jgi:hypothetical protein
MAAAEDLLRRRARGSGVQGATDETKPIVELQLTGVLPFDRAGLDVAALETLVRDIFDPLHVIIRNLTQSTAFELTAADGVSRRVLERQILAELFGQDSDFSSHPQSWASTALSLKSLALENASAEAIVQELADRMQRMETGPDEVAPVGDADAINSDAINSDADDSNADDSDADDSEGDSRA